MQHSPDGIEAVVCRRDAAVAMKLVVQFTG